MDRRYNTGEAAKQLGVHPQTLRIWERRGRIKPPARSENGQRRYSESDLESIRSQLASEPVPAQDAERMQPSSAASHLPQQAEMGESHLNDVPDWKRSTPPWEANRQTARSEVDVTRAKIERHELLRRQQDEESRRQDAEAERKRRDAEQRLRHIRAQQRQDERRQLVEAAVQAATWKMISWDQDERERGLMEVRRTVAAEIDDDWTSSYAELRGKELVEVHERRDPTRRAKLKDKLIRDAAHRVARRHFWDLEQGTLEEFERDLKRYLREEVHADWPPERVEERAHEIADDLLDNGWEDDDEGVPDESDGDDEAEDYDDPE